MASRKQSFLIPGGNDAHETFFGALASYTLHVHPDTDRIAQYGYLRAQLRPVALRRFDQNVVLIGVTKQF